MTDRRLMTDTNEPLTLLTRQRSHTLFVLSNPVAGQEKAFLDWYRDQRQATIDDVSVLRVRHYEQHEVDITRGRYPRFPFHYLSLYDLSLDGAEQASGLMERLASSYRSQAAAQQPAMWLYYPLGEMVGRSPLSNPSMVTLAYANGLPGQEADFREWYVTRHIRHAMKVWPLVSGQCFERTIFQRPSAMDAKFETIAIYEQDGTPEEILKSFASLPEGALNFPMLDRSRFAECTYRPVQ